MNDYINKKKKQRYAPGSKHCGFVRPHKWLPIIGEAPSQLNVQTHFYDKFWKLFWSITLKCLVFSSSIVPIIWSVNSIIRASRWQRKLESGLPCYLFFSPSLVNIQLISVALPTDETAFLFFSFFWGGGRGRMLFCNRNKSESFDALINRDWL